MSSPDSKEIQELKDVIEALKQKNRELESTNADLNTEIQCLQSRDHDQNEAHEDQAQNLDQTNHDQNEAHEDQTQNLDQTNRDQNEAHEDQTQNQEQLCTIFSKLEVKEYNRVALSPVSVDKSQDCTRWWCPVHSDFENIITYYRPATEADEKIVDRARDRFKYWKNKARCCFLERKNRESNNFAPPSNWPQ